MDLLRNLLREYYASAKLYLPKDYILREFAFQTFDKGVYVRHLSFQNEALLRSYLINNTPRQAYYSSAIYREPAAERMEEKGWLGSELMFDIDADHIPGCSINELRVGDKVIEIINNECIDLAKEHELRLIDILKYDFGFTNNEIMVYFSGNRGFHTIARPGDEEWLKLNTYHRREIVDYIKGIGLDPMRLAPLPKRVSSRRVKVKPVLDYIDGGWAARLVKHGLLSEDFSNDDVLEGINKLKVEIDEQVTQDVSRLIRIPGSINGKSGLPAILLSSESEIISFRYDESISPWRGNVLIRTKKGVKLPEKIHFLGSEFKLHSEGINRVPTYLGVFLALNNLCDIIKVL